MVRMTPAAARAERSLDIDALLADPAKRIIVCCGAGGVGKTTTAAALGVRVACCHLGGRDKIGRASCRERV